MVSDRNTKQLNNCHAPILGVWKLYKSDLMQAQVETEVNNMEIT